MSQPLNLEYSCRQCEYKFWLEVWPYIQAKTWGPPEKCYPAEGGEIDPDECPECGEPVNVRVVNDMVDDAKREGQEREAEYRADIEAERRRDP